MNSMKSHHFAEKGASSRPRRQTLDKRKAWGGFWRPLCRKVSNSTENAHFDGTHGFSRKSVHFTKIPRFRVNGDFAVKGPPETAPGLTFNKGFPPRREGGSVFVRKPRKHENYGKSLKSHKIMKIAEIRGNREKRKARLGAGRGPDPAPPGGPF